MRVLMVTSFPIPGEYDGTAMLPIKILRALKARGVEVVHAHLRVRSPFGRSARGDFEGTPSFTFGPFDWVAGLRQVYREFPFDLVHAQHYGGATRAHLACRIFGWPMVYEIHSLLGDEVERDRIGRGLAFQATAALEKQVCKHAQAVIVLGEPVKRVVVEEKGVPAECVDVIYPGIDLAEYERPGAPAEIEGVGSDDKVIMYVGSIVHPNQGVPILIDALPQIFARVPNSRCVLVGGPASAGDEYRDRLRVHRDRLTVLTGQTPEQVVALDAAGGCPGTSPSRLSRKLFGAKQDRRLPSVGPAGRCDGLRRLLDHSWSDRRGEADGRRSRSGGRWSRRCAERSRTRCETFRRGPPRRP